MGRNAGTRRDMGHSKVCKWVQKKTAVLAMVTVKFGFDFSFSTESRGSIGTTHGLGSPKNWFSALQLCHLGMLLCPHTLGFPHLLNEGIESFFSGILRVFQDKYRERHCSAMMENLVPDQPEISQHPTK